MYLHPPQHSRSGVWHRSQVETTQLDWRSRRSDGRTDDLDVVHRPVIVVRLHTAHPLYHLHPALDAAEYHMLAIKPLGRGQGDEELAAVCIGATVSHGQNASPWKYVKSF